MAPSPVRSLFYTMDRDKTRSQDVQVIYVTARGQAGQYNCSLAKSP